MTWKEVKRVKEDERGYADFLLLFIFIGVFFTMLIMSLEVPYAINSKYFDMVATREVGRYLATNEGSTILDGKQQAASLMSQLPQQKNGETLFDKDRDVDINMNDGQYVTVTIFYNHPWITKDFTALWGGGHPVDNSQRLSTTLSFRREW
ncbi:hypothetical protein [Aneurinibacillus terranovensis]|uniref:hypothetical protein n=1 Tax=Aneurinibacillus terranovensis TaxID=278991 RepID=UPI0003FEEA28|nr:hypothetical protein [Aneurinibacillus terranovensis]